jgi:NADH dehydrogenase (ubiquinone) 1 alpha/beta subcomplex 1
MSHTQQERLIRVVKNYEKVDASKVTPAAHFVNDLGLDTLDAVELVIAIEEEFCIEIPDDDADKIASLPQAIAYLAKHPNAK